MMVNAGASYRSGMRVQAKVEVRISCWAVTG